MIHKTLINDAKKVLNANFQEAGFTIPSKGLYPFQWKWDSGFIAIGLSYYNIAKAKLEVETLLNAQWNNGFIPHIIFHKENDSYFPGADFHCSELHPLSSKKHKSTGMTQPPITGFVLKEMYRIAEDKEDMLQFIQKHIDKVYENHLYFYTNRDPFNEGLMYIYHNWESGTDNSPVWDDIWKTMDPPEYAFERKDTTHVNASQRPSKREYDYYLHLIEIAKKHKYDDEKIAKISPFLVQDPLFNAMLIKSNEALIELYDLLGGEGAKKLVIQQWQQKSKKGFKKLFDAELGAYIHYDLRNKRPIRHITSSSFSPLFAGIPDVEKAKILTTTMLEKFGGEDKYLCASFDPTNDKFNPKKYWRGPVWINMNWMLYYGLKRYDYKELADRIKKDSIELIDRDGFFEYFDCRKENGEPNRTGYGGGNFSWSAALIIDLLKN
ncbi:alpha,alpha-trehalase [Aquimarina sp. ERC-38]|uniref:MGH1-like glycoside hydrolase domain-containing protein n=1 Tax=Aquimarina sp. ERC-38 TaxID=2949996 RepID=UPI0022468DA8|nr:trehalase family glycosidase [Aquimarina sp. ERC-38]UZO79583.1 alpha,alpha-trehalase [Aquimarina sp. ERC-38]